jgi:hypothetical protein
MIRLPMVTIGWKIVCWKIVAELLASPPFISTERGQADDSFTVGQALSPVQ